MKSLIIGYESEHVNYSSLPRQSVSPWYNYASDSECRQFNSLGRYVTVFRYQLVPVFNQAGCTTEISQKPSAVLVPGTSETKT